MANKIVLTSADVLSGHNFKWFIRDHPGNRFLDKLVEQYCEEYVNTPTQLRHHTTSQVVQRILDKGGRFLKIVSDCDQLEVQDDRAIAGKVTKLLRRRGLEIQELRQQHHRQQRLPAETNKRRLLRWSRRITPSIFDDDQNNNNNNFHYSPGRVWVYIVT
jgi:hypothetical protein